MTLLTRYGSIGLYDLSDEVKDAILRAGMAPGGMPSVSVVKHLNYIEVSMASAEDFPWLYISEVQKELRKLGAQHANPEGFCVTDVSNRVFYVNTTLLYDDLAF